ncbi:MAG: hypothetical protein HQ517_08650 [SAR324 cluster bacterium]|nr:hypothetical protein [SAR324 cluster bacterium]
MNLVREIAARYGGKPNMGQSFDSTMQVYDHFRIRLSTARQERLNILILDNRHLFLTHFQSRFQTHPVSVLTIGRT